MKKLISFSCAAAIAFGSAFLCNPLVTKAENPIVQTSFTPDPAPVVYGDELWVYTGRDRDGDNDFYYMTGWQAFSTKDMKNWTDHGCFLKDDEYSWCNKNDAWASQCIERNGKYYFYFTTTAKTGGGRAIGVGVADNPAGPFKDVLGKPLAGPNWDYIDPTVIIDDDDQAWLMFGNPKCYYVKLKEDMVTLDGQIRSFDMTEQAFGIGKNGTAYGEGPWIYKHDNLYYLVYAGFYGSDGGESMCYSYGPSVTGPWKFGGQFTKQSNCYTTHGGIIDYKDHSYMFYHMNGIPGGGTFNRSAAVEEFTYNSDGTIPKIATGNKGPEQIESLNPFVRTEAETMCWSSGVKTETCSAGGVNVSNIQNKSYIKVAGADFGEGADTFTASVASATSGGTVKLHIDRLDGEIIGSLNIGGTGGWQTWEEASCPVDVSGEHDLYLEFTGGSGYLFNIDWWKFSGPGSAGSSDVTDGIIFRNTFENSTESWNGRGAAKVSVSSEKSYEGSKALFVSEREASWNGGIKDLSTKFRPGSSYSFSANVLYDTASSSHENFFMKLQYTDADGKTQYHTIAEGTCFRDEWIQIYNTSYQIPSDAKNISVYIETETGTTSFYIDDFTAATDKTVIEGAGGHETAIGDVNCDGKINIADAVLLQKWLAATPNTTLPVWEYADLSNNGKVDIFDLCMLKRRLTD